MPTAPLPTGKPFDGCEGGEFFNPSEGCVACPENQWTSPGNTMEECNKCPDGKTVASGEGKQESDCIGGKLLSEVRSFYFSTSL